MINHQQHKRLREKFAVTSNMSISALHADVDRKTARKYLQTDQTPDQLQKPHLWRTRKDPLEAVWPEVRIMLHDAPELEAKMLFEHFSNQPDSGLEPSHLRTFQRRVRHWRATEGPDKEVFFAQHRKPGELMQLDWTYARELQVSIAGESLDHLFCHCVLPYSNWQWATRCISESFLSLVSGLQGAFKMLGKRPTHLSTDNTSSATHQVCDHPQQKREYNSDYLELCTHYDLFPMTINLGCPHEHGDVESQNRHLKRRLNQHLLLRGSRDFDSLEKYDHFVREVIRLANSKRQELVQQELAAMRPLPESVLAEYREYGPRVSSHSVIRVKKNAYSVPSRLIGHQVKVQLYESELKVYLGRQWIVTLARIRGDRGALIDFRHVIEPLLRKPGVFLNYQHREQLYPSGVYRAAYDRLAEDHGQQPGVIEYLQVLKAAADHSVQAVEEALSGFLNQRHKWRALEVRDQVAPQCRKVVELAELAPDLASYDSLLDQEVAHGD
ncbi:MAG TPA: IS21 family transposase [Verrucomicrobiales bacterium]|nr:IS21 family transposase [Verrucomicrobiales bacterium]HIL68354.1 IS21 family transposase [Verrucomicrobiota bacterium]